MSEAVRYTYRLRPGAQAVRAQLAEWDRCRFLWNEAVHQQKIGNKPTLCKLSKLLTAARKQFTWLRKGSQVAQQQMLRTYVIALNQSFTVKGRGRPKIKKKKTTLPSLEYTTRGFSIQNGCLCLPRGISIPVVWSRELPSTPKTVRIYQDSLGHWYASFTVKREIELLPTVINSIGIDWGVSTKATTTDPTYDLPYGGYRKKCAAELAKAQRKMSRRRRARGLTPSNGYKRAKKRAAKLHKKAARQNAYVSQQWANSIVANHQLIGVEDFKSKFLFKSTMARKAADSAIGAAKRELIYRGKRAGREVVLVPPAYTTMTCSSCFARNKQPLKLAERTFRCDHCGFTANRDWNAARVILATAERIRAGVDDVRHARTSFRGVSSVRSEPEILLASARRNR